MAHDLDFNNEVLKELKPEYIPYPVALRTVDIVPFYYKQEGSWPTINSDFYFLLGRKPNVDKWQCIGGFVDPSDDSAEIAASRELKEETGMEIPSTLILGVSARDIFEAVDFDTYGLFYIGSYKIDDERYMKSSHKIITNLYLVPILYEHLHDINLKPCDDIEELKWFSKKELIERKQEIIVKKHLNLIDSILYNA